MHKQTKTFLKVGDIFQRRNTPKDGANCMHIYMKGHMNRSELHIRLACNFCAHIICIYIPVCSDGSVSNWVNINRKKVLDFISKASNVTTLRMPKDSAWSHRRNTSSLAKCTICRADILDNWLNLSQSVYWNVNCDRHNQSKTISWVSQSNNQKIR